MGAASLLGRPVRLALVAVLTVAVQLSWMAEWRPFGVPGDLLLLLTIAGGMVAGPERGAALGFILGMTFDAVHTLLPFGLSALVYLSVGYAVGLIHDGVLRAAWWIPPAVTFAATIGGLVLYVLAGQLLGQNFRTPDLVRIVAVTAVLNTLLSRVALRVLRWVEAPDPRGFTRLAA